jgi:hypothetical protein
MWLRLIKPVSQTVGDEEKRPKQLALRARPSYADAALWYPEKATIVGICKAI